MGHFEYHLAAITGGARVPSRRYRIDALKPYLISKGIALKEFCPWVPGYPPRGRLRRIPWFMAAMAERLVYPALVRGFDAIILQRELISTVPTVEGLLYGPKILDVDDAIYIYRGGRAARYVARVSIGVVCGNRYLAERFSEWNGNVTVIPTGVDVHCLRPLTEGACRSKPVVGWIGTSGNLKYLELVSDGIRQALQYVPRSKLHIVSDSCDGVPDTLRPYIKFTPWRPGVEVELIPHWTVGIMPLADGEWERGKCAFKILQYMAAGIPVVASPVGMNADVLVSGHAGVPARDSKEWAEALVWLLTDRDAAARIGMAGRKHVEEKYSLEKVSTKWREVIERWL